uniref:BD-FAE-like domain-containing protein n=1 Tax=Anopheles atroparvus TaxID=41427 RepID=A0A182J6H1_ANOAO
MSIRIVGPGCRLITRRSAVIWLAFVFCLPTLSYQHRPSVGVDAPERTTFKRLGRFSRNNFGRVGCPARMDGPGQPTEETIAVWEKQYSPSAWSVRFPTAREVIDYHVKFVTDVSARNRETLETRLDIEYSSGDLEKVDIYGDNLPEDAPLFVYIHGGYWQMLDKETSAYPAKPLVDRGVRVMIVGYELCPSVTLEELVRQIKVAGEFVLNYATEHGVKHVSIAGHSAGGHLIASMLDEEFKNAVGEEFNLLKDVYLISGVYNVQELRYTTSVNRDNLLGITNSNARKLSPLYAKYDHLRSPDAGLRFHVYVAQHDSDVFRQMSTKMNDHLSSFGLRIRTMMVNVNDEELKSLDEV